MSAKGMGMWRKNAPLIWRQRVKSLLLPLVTRRTLIQIRKKVVMEKEITPHLWLLYLWTIQKIWAL